MPQLTDAWYLTRLVAHRMPDENLRDNELVGHCWMTFGNTVTDWKLSSLQRIESPVVSILWTGLKKSAEADMKQAGMKSFG